MIMCEITANKRVNPSPFMMILAFNTTKNRLAIFRP